MDFIVESAMKQQQSMPEQQQIGQANIKVIGCGGAHQNQRTKIRRRPIEYGRRQQGHAQPVRPDRQGGTYRLCGADRRRIGNR